MESKNIRYKLWERAPYADFSDNGFCASLTEYRVNDGSSAVIICPGGSYAIKAYHEGEPVALMLNGGGINAFVLDYSVSPCHKFAPLSDAMRAIRLLRSMGYEKVGILGFSAGGHLTCSLATLWNFDAYPKTDGVDLLSARPDVFIPCYPVVTMDNSFTHIDSKRNLLSNEWQSAELTELFSAEKQVSADTPEAFIWHTASDNAVSVRNSFVLAEALSKHGVPFELHIFPSGPHGLGLADDYADVKGWSAECVRFLKGRGF